LELCYQITFNGTQVVLMKIIAESDNIYCLFVL